MFKQSLTAVIPGRRNAPGPESRTAGLDYAALDFGFGAARRPGMTEWDRIQKSVELKGVNHGFA
jgi:hypothetical protein